MTGKQRQLVKQWRECYRLLDNYADFTGLGRTVERVEDHLLVLKTLRLLAADVHSMDPEGDTE